MASLFNTEASYKIFLILCVAFSMSLYALAHKRKVIIRYPKESKSCHSIFSNSKSFKILVVCGLLMSSTLQPVLELRQGRAVSIDLCYKIRHWAQ